MNPRPISINVFGILHIAFAGLGLMGLMSSWNMILGKGAAAANPMMRLMTENPNYYQWMKISTPIAAVSAIVLLVAGIGLLRLQPWARKVSIGYAIYGILFCIASMVATYLYLFQPLMAKAHQLQGPQQAAVIGGAFGGLVASVFGLVYPIFILIFMTRPRVVAAFNQPSGPPPVPPVAPA